MSLFERYLTLWVALCIVAGVALGYFLPEAAQMLGSMEVAHVNLPVAVLIWLMIIPMLLKIDFAALSQVGEHWRGIGVTLFANWAEIVTPGMFSLAQSAEIIIWCIVGGLGTLVGPVIGAMALAYLKFLLGQQSLVDNMMLLGLILTLSVLFLPRGIVPSLGTLLARAMPKRRRKRRHHRRPQREAEEARPGEALNG